MSRLIVCVAVMCLLLPGIAGAEDGSAGLAFLKLGAGGRAIGLGDAYTAVGGDASCIYWNPAGCLGVENIDVVLMHSEWFEGIRYEYAGGVRSYGDQAFGLGVVGLYMDDLERREGPTSEPDGHFGVFDISLSGTYARRLTEHLDVGGNLKFLNEKIDDESARGFAVDLGAIYRVASITGLSAGVVVQNLGPQMSFIDEKFDLPFMFRAGGAYATPVEALHGDVLAVVDFVVPNDGDTKVHLGLEYEYSKIIALRVGYRTGWDNQNVSIGLGAKVRQFRIDYAYVPFYSDLGDTHRISLGFAL